jgi:hypothetical protein
MRRLMTRNLAVGTVVVLSTLAAHATIKNPSEHRKPIKPLIGNIIFGNDLPFGEEDKYVLKNEFTLGQDKTICARAYYPMLLGELWAQVQERAAKVLQNPHLKEHCAALRVKDLAADEELFVVEVYYPNADEMTDWDQQRADVLMDGDEVSDFGCTTSSKAYKDYNTEYPFPSVLKDKPGKYECTVEFYAVYEGQTGDAKVSWDQYLGQFDITQVEGKPGFILAEGKFTLIVPEK